MRIDYSSLPAHRAIVAKNAAIVARAKARASARTTDAVRTTDPVHSQLAWKSKQQRGRFRDTILSAEPTAHNANMMGNRWVGDLKVQLDALSTADRKTALDAMRRVLDDYAQNMERGTMRPGNSGSLATDEPFLGSGATPQDVMDAQKNFWDDVANNSLAARDSTPPRDATGLQIQAIARANDQFWKAQTAHQRTPAKEWGKG
jgi:hypothetical protein